jgi:hypothetical protein
MSKPYCGINKVPNEKHRGSVKECLETSQVRYYGSKKVDKRIVDGIKGVRFKKLNTTQLYAKRGTLSGKIKKLKEKLLDTKISAPEREKTKQEGKKLVIELKEIQGLLKMGVNKPDEIKKPKPKKKDIVIKPKKITKK